MRVYSFNKSCGLSYHVLAENEEKAKEYIIECIKERAIKYFNESEIKIKDEIEDFLKACNKNSYKIRIYNVSEVIVSESC